MGIGLEHVFAREQFRIFPETAVIGHRVGNGQAVLHTHVVIVHAVARSGMHRAGAGLQGDVVAHHDRHPVIVERVLQLHALEFRSLQQGQDPVILHAVAMQGRGRQFLRKDQPFPAPLRFTLHDHVVKRRIKGHRLVARQGPGRGGPGDQGHFALPALVLLPGRGFEQGRFIDDGETHVHRGRLFVDIFDLGLRQGRGTVHAPVHRLEALHQVSRFDHFAQRPHDIGLGAIIHGQVRRIPVPQHPQAFKIRLLPAYLFLGVLAAGIAERARVHPDSGLADFLFHLVFDGQAVAIPARHVGAIIPVQAVGLDDDVLQYLVDGMAQVDVAVGVRRAVMENILVPPRPLLPDTGINILFLPAPQHLRFALRQVPLHGKIRPRQGQCVFIVHCL